MARSQGKNLISLAGDTHNAWASNLTDANGQRVGVEFATASISSPGFERVLPLIGSTVLWVRELSKAVMRLTPRRRTAIQRQP